MNDNNINDNSQKDLEESRRKKVEKFKLNLGDDFFENTAKGTTSDEKEISSESNHHNTEKEETPPKKEEELEVKVTFSSIISLIIVFGIIGGLIYLKYKTSSKARFNKKNANNPNILYHSAPPENRKNK